MCDGPSDDKDCPNGEKFHQLCCAPPTFVIPRDSWCCPSCSLNASPPLTTSALVAKNSSKFTSHLKSLLSQIRFCESTIEAYTSTSKAVSILLKNKQMPVSLLRASTKMERTKLKVKEMMGMLDGYIVGESRNGDPRFTSDDASEDSGVDTADVICTICRGGDCSNGTNDILMCDGKLCFRAYHVKCLGIEGSGEWEEEEDWQCVWCELRGECLEILNDYFPVDRGILSPRSPRSPGGSRKIVVRWDEPKDVFEGQEEVVKEKEKREEEGWDGDLVGEGGGEEEEWETWAEEDDDDESDEDFVEGQKVEGKGGESDNSDEEEGETGFVTFKIDESEINNLSDVDSDVESGEGGEGGGYGLRERKSKPLSINNPFPLNGNIGDFDEANIVLGSRRRNRPDYAKMNDSLFGNLTPRKQKRMFGDEGEGAGWESPAKKKKKKRGGGRRERGRRRMKARRMRMRRRKMRKTVMRIATKTVKRIAKRTVIAIK
ncbi:hypothetical protein TL16_g10857 [Triparma laevis f. inornata]|uniref:PHD-type domain-containing protein n=1 Tax=Triparma laevis f. inornata TaxID=1714386 RepID=A0A9W7BIR5_9STRA|nr:hypothetical protein TL16_g10857 [Triparma laevis f. inornata]